MYIFDNVRDFSKIKKPVRQPHDRSCCYGLLEQFINSIGSSLFFDVVQIWS
jgi:hypothetical protein